MNHPSPEVLLRYAEGEQFEATVVEHIVTCGECRAALAELGRFEAHFADATPIAPRERQAMRAVAEQVLARRPRLAVPRWGLASIVVALAAGVLALLSLWSPGRLDCTVGVHRYVPAGVVRGDGSERFQLQVDLAASRWLALWRLDAADRHERLLPQVDPLLRYLGSEMPLQAGVHRVPAAELLDFEFRSDAAPVALLLVPSSGELTSAELEAIEVLLASNPPDQVLKAVSAQHAEAKWIAFPAR